MASMVMNGFYKVPVIGWAVDDAVNGHKNSAWWFFLNIVLLVLLAVMTWGYAAVIVLALSLTASAIVTLVVLTAGM